MGPRQPTRSCAVQPLNRHPQQMGSANRRHDHRDLLGRVELNAARSATKPGPLAPRSLDECHPVHSLLMNRMNGTAFACLPRSQRLTGVLRPRAWLDWMGKAGFLPCSCGTSRKPACRPCSEQTTRSRDRISLLWISRMSEREGLLGHVTTT